MKRFMILIVSLTLPVLVIAQGFMRGNYEDCPVGWFGGMGWMSMILFWALAALLIAALLKWLLPQKRQSASSSLGILKDRYARGEIDQEEYQEKMETLQK